jgi:hypothetical protein
MTNITRNVTVEGKITAIHIKRSNGFAQIFSLTNVRRYYMWCSDIIAIHRQSGYKACLYDTISFHV